MIAKFSSDILEQAKEMTKKLHSLLDQHYIHTGNMPLGFLVGPIEYHILYTYFLDFCSKYPQEIPYPNKELRFIGLPVLIKSHPGIELQISVDDSLKKMSALSVEQF